MAENSSISYLLRVLNESFRSVFNQRVRDLSLTSTQVSVLLYLASRNPEPVSLKEIASFMGLSHPTVIEIVKRLDQKSYVQNFPDEKDRRCRNIQLTEQAMAVLEELEGYRAEMDDLLLEGFDAEEIRKIREILGRMRENLIRFSEK